MKVLMELLNWPLIFPETNEEKQALIKAGKKKRNDIEIVETTAETENSGSNQTRMAKKETAAIKPEKISSEPRSVIDINRATTYPEISNTDELLVANPK